MGYCLFETLEALGPTEALAMAVKDRNKQSVARLIHHSDRGVQYCCTDYVQILTSESIAISITQSGSPYENALAERINGTIKNEFYPKRVYQNHKEAQKAIGKIIRTYNERRPHASVDYLTPAQAHKREGILKKRWKHLPRVKKAAAVSEEPFLN